ncbi:MAG: hypothetical protein V9G12_19575 [Microthrixaceae bacterium]
MISIITSTTNNGVANNFAPWRVNSFWPFVVLAQRNEPTDQLEDGVRLWVEFLLVVTEHLDGGVEEDSPEHVHHPVEGVEQRSSGEDEDRPHDQGTEDAPEEHPVLVLAGHREVPKITAQTNTLSTESDFSTM